MPKNMFNGFIRAQIPSRQHSMGLFLKHEPKLYDFIGNAMGIHTTQHIPRFLICLFQRRYVSLYDIKLITP